MKELETAIIAAFNKMAESGAIEKIIEEKISKTVDSILDSALKSYSDFGKDLEKTIKDGLKVDLKKLDLLEYNHIILAIIKKKLDHSVLTVGKERLEKEMEELLASPPAEVKLSALVEMLKEGADDRSGSECTCIVEGSISDGWGHVYLDKNDDKDKHQCDYRLAYTDKGEVYSIHIDGRDPKESLFIGPLYGFERSLFQMYVAKTRLIVDRDDVDTYYSGD